MKFFYFYDESKIINYKNKYIFVLRNTFINRLTSNTNFNFPAPFKKVLTMILIYFYDLKMIN